MESMALVSTEVVRGRLSLPDDDGVNAIIDSALMGATAYIEARLRTSVMPDSTRDVFLLDTTTLALDGTYRLMLNNGFITGVKVYLAEDVGTKGAEIPVLKLYSEKGLVVIAAPDLPTYVMVDYDYGFESLDDVPYWLQEVALAKTTQLLSMQQVNDGKDQLGKIASVIHDHQTAILDAHLRKDSWSIRPMV